MLPLIQKHAVQIKEDVDTYAQTASLVYSLMQNDGLKYDSIEKVCTYCGMHVFEYSAFVVI